MVAVGGLQKRVAVGTGGRNRAVPETFAFVSAAARANWKAARDSEAEWRVRPFLEGHLPELFERASCVVMKIKRFKNIDYGFRPESYWEVSDPLQTILANVQGTQRRRMIRERWDAGRIEELADAHLLDVLDEETRVRIGKVHPSFMGGEYLPVYKPGQIEIVRIELESTTSDVISVRAAPKGSRIVYSIVDEYESEFQVAPAYSEKPLTLGKLVAMMDRAVDGKSLGTVYTLGLYDSRNPSIEQLDRLRSFTRVESDFYLQLSVHYKKVIDHWCEREKGKIGGG